jgi:hypothetical protein
MLNPSTSSAMVSLLLSELGARRVLLVTQAQIVAHRKRQLVDFAADLGVDPTHRIVIKSYEYLASTKASANYWLNVPSLLEVINPSHIVLDGGMRLRDNSAVARRLRAYCEAHPETTLYFQE